jgi:BNR repeat-like domain
MRFLQCTVAILLGLSMTVAYAQSSDGLIFQPLASGKALPGTQRDNHASTLVELRNGDVMVAWFGGSREGAPDVKIYAARLHHGVWSKPVVLASADGVACWSPVLFHTLDGRLWLYYKYVTHPSTWKGARKWSNDEGVPGAMSSICPTAFWGQLRTSRLCFRMEPL